MKKQVQELIAQSLKSLESKEILPTTEQINITVENSRDSAHGDFATNIAMVLAKVAKTNPRQLAQNIIEYLPESDILEKTEIAGPGFINFFLKQNTHQSVIIDILDKGDNYGDSNIGNNTPTLVEFVSANPTGPLHIGHGRGAAYGAVVANLLKKAGYDVSCEYYVNDAGRQMDILAVSVWLRYLQHCGQDISFPENGYKGDYINDIAIALHLEHADKFVTVPEKLLSLYNEEDAELKIDMLIKYCTEELGKENYRLVFDAGLNHILETIKTDLVNFGVKFDTWFSERSLVDDDIVTTCITKLIENDWVYEKDGAQWFRSSKLGDEKDRVLIRENGQATYFASDIAYHLSKVERGFEKIIDIWGADHHGYIARVKASMQALGLAPEKLEILLVQFATLYRGKERLQMSTRSGEFITLEELQNEVGKDATRFFYIMRKSEQHLDFDMELAKSQSNDNPVYYIQYAHARICSVFRQIPEKGYTYKQEEALKDLSVLTEPQEIKLLSVLARYPEVIENAAQAYEPHQLVYYLKDLANDFHSYYNTSQFLIDNNEIRNARLVLIVAIKQVIKNTLSLIGVSSPEEM
ncbi:MAG: arginine--tRNA ligase [Proteobacteria bacterium]|nr:arginine--tRNA ligase [Pseudomonadota bacterium]NOG60413.1 arginine--tRNA ligase [Pseudomonadota bacterium]